MDDLASAKTLHILSWIYGERNGKVKLSKQNSLICLQRLDKDYFQNVYVILVISATLPGTSCECERSISLSTKIHSKKKKRCKSYFDSTGDQLFHICIKTVIILLQI